MEKRLWFFTIPLDFGLNDQGVTAVQPPPTSSQPPLTSTTKKRSKETSPLDNIPKKTRSGYEIQSQLQLEAMKEKGTDHCEEWLSAREMAHWLFLANQKSENQYTAPSAKARWN